MKNRDGHDKISYYTYFSALFGVIIGSLFFLLCIACFDMGLMDNGLEDYKVSAVMNLPVGTLFLYILKRRLGQILLFFILVTLFSYAFTASFFNIIFGIYYGMVVSNLFIKFGINGIYYSLACFFPHYLIYFFVIYLLGRWVYSISAQKNSYYGNVNKLQYFVKFFVIFFLMVAAIIWEIKFQKNILNFFYQYLV